jgi:hypothetical protein
MAKSTRSKSIQRIARELNRQYNIIEDGIEAQTTIHTPKGITRMVKYRGQWYLLEW